MLFSVRFDLKRRYIETLLEPIEFKSCQIDCLKSMSIVYQDHKQIVFDICLTEWKSKSFLFYFYYLLDSKLGSYEKFKMAIDHNLIAGRHAR